MEIKLNKQGKLIKFLIRQYESYLHLKLKLPIQFTVIDSRDQKNH